jgi:hypothetical protein
VLIDLFSAWALALVLLLVVAARAIAARETRIPAPGELAVLLGFGVAVCSLAQTPLPWSQAERLRLKAPAPALFSTAVERFVAAHVRPGERITLQAKLGDRIAYDLKVTDVMPYASAFSMPERRQLATTVQVARHEGVRDFFFQLTQMSREMLEYLLTHGYRLVRQDAKADAAELVDTR